MVLTVGVMTLANQCAVIAAPDDLACICEFRIPGVPPIISEEENSIRKLRNEAKPSLIFRGKFLRTRTAERSAQDALLSNCQDEATTVSARQK